VSNARSRQSRGVRSAALAVALLLAGALAAAVTVAADASGTVADSHVQLSLGYTCSFPVGSRQVPTAVGVAIAATFPDAVAAGQRIQPTGVQITVRLPAAAVAALRESGATTVSSTAVLAVDMSQQTTTASWHAQTQAAQPLPASGSLKVVAPGQATPVTAADRGTVTFTAAGLTLTLHLAGATGASATSDSPSPGSEVSASPSSSPSATDLSVACTPASQSDTALDAIPVVAATASAATKAPAHRAKPKLPKDCGHIKVHGTGTAVCGYITGYSDVLKLYGAAPLQPKRPARPALVNIDFAYRHVIKPGKLIEYSTGELYYQGHHELPPVRATFLAFRFVPVTATLMVTELTPIQIRSVSGITAPPYPITVRATTRVRIRISDVDVNGVRLAIGPHCRPVSSPRLTLIGRGDNTIPPKGYTVPTGGPLSGRLTIPAFTGCGVTENLDPLLTGSISGPGNYVLMTQGRLCGPANPRDWTCPPPVPKPAR